MIIIERYFMLSQVLRDINNTQMFEILYENNTINSIYPIKIWNIYNFMERDEETVFYKKYLRGYKKDISLVEIFDEEMKKLDNYYASSNPSLTALTSSST